MKTPVLRLSNVSVRLGSRLALDSVTCEIPPGSFLGLIGPNGSGKSTMLRAILGIVPLAAGEVRLDERATGGQRNIFAYLPQRSTLELDLPLRAIDVVLMGRLRHAGWMGVYSRADRDIAEQALERVGLADRRNSSIAEMSFGQQQRVLFARALAQEGRILLLDEPMNGVDVHTQSLFLDVLRELKRESRTIVMATHDLNQAADHCDLICVLNQRLMAFGPTRETLTEDVLLRAYGVHLHMLHGEGDVQHLDHIFEEHHHDAGHGA
jgi:manganese/iron transport system ATP-binding protein